MTEVVTNVVVGLPHQRADAGSIGWASPEYDVRIVDPGGTDVPPGERGELVIRGVRGLSLFAEYLGDPGATAKAFDERGYFHTGDGVRQLDSGSIQYVTRLKDMDQLADFKVPRSVHLIDELPEKLLGKIAKADLRDLAAKLAGT